MAKIQWQVAFETGIPEIDSQHQKFVGLINRLDDCAEGDPGSGECSPGSVLSDLVNYTHYHFACEEKLQEEIGFSEREAHLARHNELLHWLNDQLGRSEARGGPVIAELLNFLMDWFLQHVLMEDQKFGSEYVRLHEGAGDLELCLVDAESTGLTFQQY